MIDVGRYPEGVDEVCAAVCAALSASKFLSRPTPDVMRLKYAKLLLNVGNAAQALCEPGERCDELTALAAAEGEAVLAAAGIEHVADEVTDISGRWTQLGVRDIDGRQRAGSSTWQSLARGTGAIETDYLNGEIVLEGRLHGVATPVNEALCRLAARAARWVFRHPLWAEEDRQRALQVQLPPAAKALQLGSAIALAGSIAAGWARSVAMPSRVAREQERLRRKASSEVGMI